MRDAGRWVSVTYSCFYARKTGRNLYLPIRLNEFSSRSFTLMDSVTAPLFCLSPWTGSRGAGFFLKQ